jgi:RNA polymerase sigma-70 factor (ECF subfamily)
MSQPHDDATFAAFYQRSWGRLFGQAYVLTGDRELAQDLTQEALLKTWKQWTKVAAYESPEGWTRRVLHNLCIDSWRKTSQPGAHLTMEHSPVTSEIPAHHQQLAQAMRGLPGEQARALLLHDGLGLTVPEVAREIGAAEGTVKSWLSRSRKVVAARLDALDRDRSWR